MGGLELCCSVAFTVKVQEDNMSVCIEPVVGVRMNREG